jgi:hypothetical protein
MRIGLVDSDTESTDSCATEYFEPSETHNMSKSSLSGELRKFHGGSKQDVTAWCEKFKVITELEEWKDRVKIAAVMFLEGDTEKYYLTRKNSATPPRIWEKLKALLVSKLTNNLREDEARYGLDKLRHKKIRDLDDFINEFCTIASSIKEMYEKTRVHRFRASLGGEYERELLKKGTATLSEAINEVRLLHARTCIGSGSTASARYVKQYNGGSSHGNRHDWSKERFIKRRQHARFRRKKIAKKI